MKEYPKTHEYLVVDTYWTLVSCCDKNSLWYKCEGGGEIIKRVKIKNASYIELGNMSTTYRVEGFFFIARGANVFRIGEVTEKYEKK